MARPTDVVNVSLSGCTPATYYAKIIYPNNSYIIKFDKNFTVNGPFKIEAACSLVGGSTGPIRNAEVMLAPGNGLRVVANKNQAAVSEAVVLTAYGCDFGQLQWKWGTSGTAGNVNPLTVYGPGYYYTRCVSDPAVAPEWTLTNIASAAPYTPTVSGPTRVCPNSPVTLTASGCPVESNGTPWSYQWKTAENGWNNFNASITVYLPQTVSVRCAKPDGSFYSDTKEITVESPFSESFKASNTGPVSVGANVMLTATPIENATFTWYYPDGTTQVVAIADKITLGAAGRTISITGADPTMAGVYTVKAKITGSGTNGYCETSATTDLGISLCDDFVIRAKNPQSGEYTTRMPRKPNSRDQFDKLILTLENFAGAKPLYLTPIWSGPNGTPTRGEDAFTVEAPVMGTYKVNLGAGCEVEIDLSAQPCTLLDDSFKQCSQAGDAVSIDNNKLTALSVDDYFNAGDYEVKVTEVSGDANNGWTGKGYTTFSIMSGIETDVAVEFTGIQIDQCYQLKAGTVNKVSVQYDPTWSNFIQPSKFMSLIGDFLDDLDAWVQTYKNDPNSQESKDVAAELYEMALVQKLAIDADVVLTRSEIDEVLDGFNPVVNGLLMAKNGGSSPNGRLANDCPSWTDFECYLNKARETLTGYFGKYWRVLQINYAPFCEKNLDGSQKCGIVPKILWQSDPLGSLAFDAGLIDGAYFTLKEVGGTVYSLTTLVGCMNPTTGAANFVTNADCRKKLTDGWDMIVGIGSLVKEPSKVWGIVKTETVRFVQNNAGFQPINKYYNGRFAFDVALMFIGVGEVSAILKGMNAVKAAELLQKAAAIAERFNVVGRMMSKAGLAISKKSSKVASFVVRKAGDQVPTVVFDYVNGVYKGLKQKTAAFNRYIGIIEGDVELADGTKKKGTFKLWGKCAPGAGLRMSSGSDPVPDGDGCPIDDAAAELIKKNWKSVQRIQNRHPLEELPKDGTLFGIADIEDGVIKKLGDKGDTFPTVDFVVTTDGNLKLGRKHHFLGDRGDVEAAGTLKISKGKVTRISNDSGHYLPSLAQADKFQEIFEQLGLNVKGTALHSYYLDETGKFKEIIKFLK